jgi:6-phosphogluconolactonase
MIHCFQSADELVEKLSLHFLDFITRDNHSGSQLNIALSGGNTPEAFFGKISLNQNKYDLSILWNKVHLFWVDERCVTPRHADSNFGMTSRTLLSKINLQENNIHRIRGENDPDLEALRYAREIKSQVMLKDGYPVFDCIFLGIGDDGHTASIFPDRLDLLTAEKICETVKHPVTGQSRVTLTGKSILQAKRTIFLVTGESKSLVIKQIMNNEPEASRYPAAYIYFNKNNAEWYMDAAAAKLLKSSTLW